MFNPFFSRLVRRPSAGRLVSEVVVMEEHNEAYDVWLRHWRAGKTPPAALLHFDSHADMAMPRSWKTRAANRSVRASELGIDEFIVAACHKGMIDRLIWVHSRWTFGMLPSTGPAYEGLSFHVCAPRRAGVRGAVSMPMSFYMIGSTDAQRLVDSTGNCWGGLDHDRVPIRVDVVHYDQAADVLPKILSRLAPQTPLLLDIDEDTFAVTHPRALRTNTPLVRQMQRIVRHLIQPRVSIFNLALRELHRSTGSRWGENEGRKIAAMATVAMHRANNVTREIIKWESTVGENRKLSKLLKLLLEGIKALTPDKDELYRTILGSDTESSTNKATKGLIDELYMEYMLAPFEAQRIRELWPHDSNEPPEQGISLVLLLVVSGQLDSGAVREDILHGKMRSAVEALLQVREPSVITICRSVSSGFTPEDLQPTIEGALLQLLGGLLPNAAHVVTFPKRPNG